MKKRYLYLIGLLIIAILFFIFIMVLKPKSEVITMEKFNDIDIDGDGEIDDISILFAEKDKKNGDEEGDIKLKVKSNELVLLKNVSKSKAFDDSLNGYQFEVKAMPGKLYAMLIGIKYEFVTKYGSQSWAYFIKYDGQNLVPIWDSDEDLKKLNEKDIKVSDYNITSNVLTVNIDRQGLNMRYDESAKKEILELSKKNKYPSLEFYPTVDYSFENNSIITKTIVTMGYLPL